MKLSKLKLIIKEEVEDFFNSDAPKPKFKKGDKINYRGLNYFVISDNGYVVNVVDEKGNKSMYNHNQLNQGMYRRPDHLFEAEVGITVEELPKFNELPEEGYDNSIWITLPNVKEADAGIILYSKDAVRRWENEFINRWGLRPGEEKIRFSLKNNNIVNASDDYYRWKSEYIKTKGAAYDRLGRYKGD